MNVVLTSIGSRGDVQPIVVVGKILKEQGHRVKICAPPDFRELVESQGLRFFEVGRDINEWIRSEAEDKFTGPFRKIMVNAMVLKGFLQFFETEIPSQFAAFEQVVAEDDELIIAAGLHAVARTVAEIRGIPAYYLYYTPNLIPSEHHAPVFLPFLNTPRLINRLLWWMTNTLLSRAILRPLLPLRAKLNMSTPSSFWDIMPSNGLLAFDAQLAPLSDGVEGDRSIYALQSLTALGSLAHKPEKAELSPEVEAFLAGGPPPIYLGYGSMPDLEADETLGMLEEACEQLKVRIIYNRGKNKVPSRPTLDSLLIIERAPHHLLFPRTKMVIHHGGAGTVAAAARAGVPQMAVPHFVDQFFWGNQIHLLGLGPKPVKRIYIKYKHLRRAIAWVDGESELQGRCQTMSQSLQKSDVRHALQKLLEEPALESIQDAS